MTTRRLSSCRNISTRCDYICRDAMRFDSTSKQVLSRNSNRYDSAQVAAYQVLVTRILTTLFVLNGAATQIVMNSFESGNQSVQVVK